MSQGPSEQREERSNPQRPCLSFVPMGALTPFSIPPPLLSGR